MTGPAHSCFAGCTEVHATADDEGAGGAGTPGLEAAEQAVFLFQWLLLGIVPQALEA